MLKAHLPPHLKRSINLGYLENGTYDQIVAHLKKELELNRLETHGELPVPTMVTTVNKQTQPQNAEQQQIFCRYCRKTAQVIRGCRKRIRKEQERQDEEQITERPNAKTLCQRTNHTANMCWNGPNTANKPKRFKSDNHNDSIDEKPKPGTSTQNALTSIFKNLIN